MKKPKNTLAFKRKIKDSYEKNPLKIYNQEETKKFNEKEREKYIKKEKAYNNVFGSINCKRTLGGINKKQTLKKYVKKKQNLNQNFLPSSFRNRQPS